MERRKKKREKKQPLLDNEEDVEDGSSNPALDSETETAYQAFSHTEGESSAAEILEAGQAETLKKELKTKHRRKLKELSQLRSPQDDLAGEIKDVKKRSRKKLDETAQEELETQRSALAASADDGTVPMPESEAITEETAPKIQEDVQFISETARTEDAASEKPVPTLDTTMESVEGETKSTLRSSRGQSVRERLRSRIQKAKEKADSELREEERQEVMKRRDERMAKKATRFDQDYDEEEMERMLEEKSKLLKSRRQKMEEGKQKGEHLPSSEEAYDFFTKEWEPEPDAVEMEAQKQKADEEAERKKKKRRAKAEASKEGEEEAEDEEGEEDGEEKEDEQEEEKEEDESKPEEERPLIEEFAHDEEGIGPIAFRKSEYIPQKKKQESDDMLLFIPSVISRPASEKVDEEKMPRFLEEEGFYVGVRPSVPGRNLNRMENRLLHEPDKGRKWFGEDGRLIALPNPLRQHPSRPVMTDEQEPYLETVFRMAVMRNFDSRYIDGAMDGGGRYQLDVDINSIVFSHHHLFSKEHVLATRLTEIYQDYLIRKQKNMTEFLTEKIKALKSSAVHLHEYILNNKGNMEYKDRVGYEKRLKDYKYDIRQTRIVRDKEEETDRMLLKNIIHTWKELKSLREFQNYNNTPVKMQLIKEQSDKAKDQMIWKQEIEEELMEIQEEFEEEYQKKLALYKEDLEAYEKQQAAKKEAMKRSKKRRKGRKGATEDLEQAPVLMSEEDRALLNEEDLPEPVPPEEFDSKLTRDKIKAKAMAIRRRPGEPKLIPELTNTATVTNTNQCPRGEQNRRDDVSKTKVFLKILFNNKEVSRTSAKPLSQDFRVTFGQIYNLKIVQWPESVKFQIYESRGLGTDLLAELYAGIPEPSVTSQSVQLEEMDFSTDLKIDISHEGVGSGIPFTFDVHGTNTMILMTTGVLCSSVAWSVAEDGTPLVPPTTGYSSNNVYNAMKLMDPVAAIGATGVVNIERLAKWFKESRLDPNDPNNADLVYMLGNKTSTNMQSRDFFRLEQLQQEFDFTTEHELNQNKRFRLLYLRDSEVQEFKNMKMVPALERELGRDIFKEYERKQREEERIKHTEDIESQRAAVNRFMNRVREEVMRRFRMAAHQKRLEDMVIEEVVPNIGIVLTRILRFGEPRRPLKPVRKERKRVTAAAVRGEEVKILMNVIRASSVPIRKTSSGPAKEDGGQTTRDYEMKPVTAVTLVRPYIEVMFQRNTVRTSVGDGPNPSFNEELELPLKVPNDDFSPNNLQSMGDFVYINLFDEVVIDIHEDDRTRATSIHQRLEKKWLGNLKIPFSTIYLNNKIVGTFRLDTPPVMLGYTYEDSMRRNEPDSVVKIEHSTYISMFLTIEPQLLAPEPVRESFTTDESLALMDHAEAFRVRHENAFPHRPIKYSVVDVNGKNMFITRYFKPLNIPDDIKQLNLTPEALAERVAHYVAMIPFISDSAVFHGLCDIWSTCDQFLKMLAGDEEEHAVLLMNYFLELQKEAYLLIGSAVPEGPTAYVLTREGQDWWLWNASTGEHFSVRDSYCPVQVVNCVMNNRNIWANVQIYDKPVQMNFKLNNTSLWRPMFDRSFPDPNLGSIQPEKLHYRETDRRHAEELQEKIEQQLKNKIMDWRSRTLTRWNRHCTKIMRKLLPVLEESAGQEVNHQHLAELENSFSAYKVSGFPMNMQFVDFERIVESVYSTGVHTQESADEFALAVYIHPYSNSVLSVWVYVASLTK